ncbi:MAG: type II toxin-antitoxin system MqsA family antitoxin [Proteobacteria bacterium]|nr:type II toxin-antitoxin system MqsA family antitoxin [Pseudomonadota bacterium]
MKALDAAFAFSSRCLVACDGIEAAAGIGIGRDRRESSGSGVNAFSRYETGKTKPPLALVKLLRVLDRHPELVGAVWVGQVGIAALQMPFSRPAPR